MIDTHNYQSTGPSDEETRALIEFQRHNPQGVYEGAGGAALVLTAEDVAIVKLVAGHDQQAEPANPEIQRQKEALSVFFDLLGVTDPRLRNSAGLQQLLFSKQIGKMYRSGKSTMVMDYAENPLINEKMMAILSDLVSGENILRETTNPTDDRNKRRLQAIKEAGGIEEIQVSALVDRPELSLSKPGQSNPTVNDQGFIEEPGITFIMRKENRTDGTTRQYARKISRIKDEDGAAMLAYEIFAISTGEDNGLHSKETRSRSVRRFTCFYDNISGEQITRHPEVPFMQVMEQSIPKMPVSEISSYKAKSMGSDTFHRRVMETRTEDAGTMIPYLSNYGKGKRTFIS